MKRRLLRWRMKYRPRSGDIVVKNANGHLFVMTVIWDHVVNGEIAIESELTVGEHHSRIQSTIPIALWRGHIDSAAHLERRP